MNNIKVKCRGPGLTGSLYTELTGQGGDLGDWGSYSSECPSGTAICAVSANYDMRNSGDSVGLSDVKFKCC